MAKKGVQHNLKFVAGGQSEDDLSGCRVAILGGDSRQAHRWPRFKSALFFMARRYGGNGELRSLVARLRAKSIDLVIILARWNGHSATKQVQRLCRTLGVRVIVVP